MAGFETAPALDGGEKKKQQKNKPSPQLKNLHCGATCRRVEISTLSQRSGDWEERGGTALETGGQGPRRREGPQLPS